jgi:hypothetical protein
MEHKIFGDKIVFFELVHDDCPPNPLEDFDGYGTIWSFSQKHVNYKDPREIECDPDRVGLSYYQHGNCLWFVPGTRNCPDMQWDGCEHAGIWEPDEYLLKEVKGLDQRARRKQMEKFAEQACEIYTAWCNGEVYEARARVFKLKKTEDGQEVCEDHYYDDKECIEEDGMGNCFGYEGEKEAQKMIDKMLAKYEKAQAA